MKVDRSVFNPSRITKLYGTKACKGDNTPERPHRHTGILEEPETVQVVPRSHLEELASSVTSTPGTKTQATKTEQAPSRGAVRERARAYLEKLPPAISGDHGHDRTFHAACTLVLGFALPVEEALPLLQHYSQRCQPPWKEEELLHKLRDADKKETLRGYLLGKTQQILESSNDSRFQADFLNSETLQRTARTPQWLVKHILLAGQPAAIGGPKKALKTSDAFGGRQWQVWALTFCAATQFQTRS